MSNKTVNIVKSDTEIKQEEKEIVGKIKPKLEKFLIDNQVNKAAETAHKVREDAEAMILFMDETKANEQAGKLAVIAFIDKKLWETKPPALEMAWATGRRMDGTPITEAQGKKELRDDIIGFSSYLVREYFNMKDDILKGKYPNPMLEESLDFFWDKFYLDTRLLLQTDLRLMEMGNKSVLATNED